MQGNSFKASAPGRLDVMGGIADYSGSLVLQKAITQQTSVELALREDYRCIISSRLHTGEILSVDQDYRSFLNNGEVDYAFAQRAFKQNPKDAWSAYILGCALVLQKEKGVNFKGADIELQSEVPNGKGVASSASVEIASMQTLASAFNVAFSGTELALLAQRAENLIVGAPCGLMDQLTSSFGKPDALLPIICQPDLVQISGGEPTIHPQKLQYLLISPSLESTVVFVTKWLVPYIPMFGVPLLWGTPS